MKKYLVIACMVALGSMMSQAAGLNFVPKANPPVDLDRRPNIPAWVLDLKGQGQSIKEQLVQNPGPINLSNKPWSGVKPAVAQNGNGTPRDPENGIGNGPSVPEPEGLGALLAMGLALVFFGGYQVQRRRLVRSAA